METTAAAAGDRMEAVEMEMGEEVVVATARNSSFLMILGGGWGGNGGGDGGGGNWGGNGGGNGKHLPFLKKIRRRLGIQWRRWRKQRRRLGRKRKRRR